MLGLARCQSVLRLTCGTDVGRFRLRYQNHALSTSTRSNVLDELEARGLVQAVTSRALRYHLDKPRTVYLGIDPSARSLHVGNLLALVGLLHFQLHGHRVIALIGSATGSVGDPSGRSSERVALSQEILDSNTAAIANQIRSLFQNGLPLAARRLQLPLPEAANSKVCFANNRDWIGKLSLLDFLSGPGKRARLSTMLARESVKSRLSSSAGISFTEFSYQLLQAYDFYRLHADQGCTLQLGGSDQWGNIQSGIDMIRREAMSIMALIEEDDAAAAANALTNDRGTSEQPAYGLTFPLLTTSSGAKFGKSAGNAIWLDPSMTSPFEFFQYFLRTTDTDCIKYLRIFSFRPVIEINEVVARHQNDPTTREAQKMLAADITQLVHGEAGLRKARTATEVVYGDFHVAEHSTKDILEAFSETPQLVQLSSDRAKATNIADVSIQIGLFKSKAQVKQAIQNGALTINGNKVGNPAALFSEFDLLDDSVAIVNAGKRAIRIVEVV